MNRPEALQPAIRVLMMPRDTNSAGTIFGAEITYVNVNPDRRPVPIRPLKDGKEPGAP